MVDPKEHPVPVTFPISSWPPSMIATVTSPSTLGRPSSTPSTTMSFLPVTTTTDLVCTASVLATDTADSSASSDPESTPRMDFWIPAAVKISPWLPLMTVM
ncbi:hypothetical protein OGAPHI_004372 [Ogataea philodendri]|uniref:Uncharacterized protein n=1 Tax=Ogataea philodendri TaxID=1378263 RepID=A0A9P8T4P7_9ASCO|nr:uncharacterized protein OGAPHI_004372 [Ogataea philodendri]KAH3666183.1 hypothetical protein OGAPHI_004372 [Ogataea philodendri]